jgi:hypothetical protein
MEEKTEKDNLVCLCSCPFGILFSWSRTGIADWPRLVTTRDFWQDTRGQLDAEAAAARRTILQYLRAL